MDSKVLREKELSSLLNDWHQKKYKLVFTNGCFDLLHPGHISYLEEAKKLGDKLILGVNSDPSVQALKGPTRPINTLKDRLIMLQALSSTDLLIPFDEPTPLRLIKEVKPDLLVKGGDYKADEIIGSEFVRKLGGKVIILSFLEGYSSTNLINKIKQQG